MQSTNRQQIERSLNNIDKNTKEVYSPAVVVMADGKNTYTCHGGHIFKVVNVIKGTIDWTKTDSNVLNRDETAPTGSDGTSGSPAPAGSDGTSGSPSSAG